MKKILKLIKSDSTFLLIIIHVITTLAFIIFVSLKYDWIVEQFGSYTLFAVWFVPIGGFINGGYYFIVDYYRGISAETKKSRITSMNDSADKDTFNESEDNNND